MRVSVELQTAIQERFTNAIHLMLLIGFPSANPSHLPADHKQMNTLHSGHIQLSRRRHDDLTGFNQAHYMAWKVALQRQVHVEPRA
jgi:hypothetical protein